MVGRVLRVLSPLILIVFAAASSVSPARAPQRPNILLIVLDTLRYDATSFGNPAANNTPFLASLEPRSVVFTNAYSTHDFTPTSHFEIFTGIRGGLGTADDRVENGVAWQLAHAGYHTFSTVGNRLLSRKQMPVMGGFTDAREFIFALGETPLDAMNDLAKIDMRLRLFGCALNDRNRGTLLMSAVRLLPVFDEQIENARAPYFGFVNVLDAHDPYAPDPQFYPPEKTLPQGFTGEVVARRPSRELAHPELITDAARRKYIEDRLRVARSAALVTTDMTREQLATYRRRYDAKVQRVDARLAELFHKLEADKQLDNTIVIITSDHGESFGEADLITHNFHDQGDYESTHHVPLIVVFPPSMQPRVHRIDRRVSTASIAPTLYDLARINWSGLAVRHHGYPLSLAKLFTRVQAPLSVVALPRPKNIDRSGEATERLKAMKSLGYIQ